MFHSLRQSLNTVKPHLTLEYLIHFHPQFKGIKWHQNIYKVFKLMLFHSIHHEKMIDRFRFIEVKDFSFISNVEL